MDPPRVQVLLVQSHDQVAAGSVLVGLSTSQNLLVFYHNAYTKDTKQNSSGMQPKDASRIDTNDENTPEQSSFPLKCFQSKLDIHCQLLVGVSQLGHHQLVLP
jgi:hypothetical protein